MKRGRLHVVGVRHHSPACARLVAHEIARLKPAAVLIEGPADMNDRLDELRLPHTLPIAVYSFVRFNSSENTEATHTPGTFSPFCQTSPEWQALQAGNDTLVRFIDLPAWDKAFLGRENRYSDGARRHSAAVKRLCAHFHIDGYDALWDHLFEGADSEGDDLLLERLDAYFVALRNDEAGDSRDGPREAFMQQHIRAALWETRDSFRPVVVVCGGYHAPVLLLDEPDAPQRAPTVEWPEGAASYLVPWSFQRLDAFLGYAAGMPSPGYYDLSFAHGAVRAAELALQDIVMTLRREKQPTSSADLIAASTMTEGLARMRGHATPLRTDLLDGLASALVKQAMDAPLPWAELGPVTQAADALLRKVLGVLSGTQRGRLSDGTPLPPIVSDAEAQLKGAGLAPSSGPSIVERLKLHEPRSLTKSRLLHRLRLLSIPGFQRQSGPQPGSAQEGVVLEERWAIADHDDRIAALIEAAIHGATVETACVARLEQALDTTSLMSATQVLGDAVLAGLMQLSQTALLSIRRVAASENDLAVLGASLRLLLGLFRADALFGVRQHIVLGECIVELCGRGVWLLEQVSGPSSPSDGRRVDAVAALRDAARESSLPEVRDPFLDVCQRRAHAADAPPAMRGACLGALWSLRALNDDGDAITAVRQMARPLLLGDFLAGLFATAREEVTRDDSIMAVVDEVVASLLHDDFLIALPALRLAFSFFPPREKATLAHGIAARHGKGAAAGAQLLTLDVDVDVTTIGLAIDDDVDAVLVRYGLAAGEGT